MCVPAACTGHAVCRRMRRWKKHGGMCLRQSMCVALQLGGLQSRCFGPGTRAFCVLLVPCCHETLAWMGSRWLAGVCLSSLINHNPAAVRCAPSGDWGQAATHACSPLFLPPLSLDLYVYLAHAAMPVGWHMHAGWHLSVDNEAVLADCFATIPFQSQSVNGSPPANGSSLTAQAGCQVARA